jgi:ADP-ribosylglycohydrolase
MEKTRLFDKIYAAMLGGAIGDAMGAPVEGWDYTNIEATYGHLSTFAPFNYQPDYHGAFEAKRGIYTDDTRLKHILCDAIIAKGGLPSKGDFTKTCSDYFYTATTELQRGFIEEYMLSGMYGEEMLIFGGQPTNGAIMMNSPLGLICPCDPETAFKSAYELAYITDGYAKYSSAMIVAAISAAMSPAATIDSIIDDMFKATKAHRIAGERAKKWKWFEEVYLINDRLVNTALEIAARSQDVFEVRQAFYEKLLVSPLGSEAAQSLAVALGMFYAARGDFQQAVIGAVNYGRDNDSYASIAGALAGAFCGTKAIPEEWVSTVQTANPDPNIRSLSLELTKIALSRQRKAQAIVKQVSALLDEK